MVVAVHSPKGGVGTSFVAGAIAVAVAARGELRAALVDMSTTGAGAPALLGAAARDSMLTLVPASAAPAVPSRAAVDSVAGMHRSGLVVLSPTPLDPATARFDGVAVGHLINGLRRLFDVVVIDVTAGIDDRSVAALAAADSTLLVVTPEVPCVIAVRLLVDALAEHGFDLSRLRLLLNMASPSDGVDGAHVAAALSVPLAGMLPFAPCAVRASINGLPDQCGATAGHRPGPPLDESRPSPAAEPPGHPEERLPNGSHPRCDAMWQALHDLASRLLAPTIPVARDRPDRPLSPAPQACLVGQPWWGRAAPAGPPCAPTFEDGTMEGGAP